jgi:membrane-associated HD superfamily phosphohydrolase
MGIIINSSNYFVDNVLDILLVFGLGSVLLFFAHIMKNESKFTILYLSIFIIIVLIYFLVYAHNTISEEDKEKTQYNILSFLGIYTIILLMVLSGMSYYLST